MAFEFSLSTEDATNLLDWLAALESAASGLGQPIYDEHVEKEFVQNASRIIREAAEFEVEVVRLPIPGWIALLEQISALDDALVNTGTMVYDDGIDQALLDQTFKAIRTAEFNDKAMLKIENLFSRFGVGVVGYGPTRSITHKEYISLLEELLAQAKNFQAVRTAEFNDKAMLKIENLFSRFGVGVVGYGPTRSITHKEYISLLEELLAQAKNFHFA